MGFGTLWGLLATLSPLSGDALYDSFERVGDGFCLDALNLGEHKVRLMGKRELLKLRPRKEDSARRSPN